MEWWRRLLPLQQWRNNQKAEDATSIHDVPDEVLRLILLRLDSPIWLVRAASTCKRWRRVITEGPDEGRAFLRLASSLHPPTVAGQYHNKRCGYIRFVPPSSLPIDDGNRFSVDFLDMLSSCWHVVDCHGGLVLLCGSSLIVYDPLTCQLRHIYSPPPQNHQVYRYYHVNLLLHGDDGNISISNFRVLHQLNVVDASNPMAYVFSTANGGEWDWHFIISRSPADEDIFRHCYGCMVAGRADDGSLYMVVMRTDGFGTRIITLDNTSLVLSRVNLPTTRVLDMASLTSSTFAIVHGPDVVDDLGPCSSLTTSIVHVRGKELELFRRHVHGRDEWVLEHSIPNLSEATGLLACLDKEYDDVVWKTMVGHISDGGASSFAILSAHSYTDRWWFFSFDVNTMELRVLPAQELYLDTWKAFNYTLPWPQFLRTCP